MGTISQISTYPLLPQRLSHTKTTGIHTGMVIGITTVITGATIVTFTGTLVSISGILQSSIITQQYGTHAVQI